MTYDLGIEGGIVVGSTGQVRQSIYFQDGVVANLTTDRHPARHCRDATELFVLPGMIDGHVHFQDPGDSDREDFVTGSGSAAVGGACRARSQSPAAAAIHGESTHWPTAGSSQAGNARYVSGLRQGRSTPRPPTPTPQRPEATVPSDQRQRNDFAIQ